MAGNDDNNDINMITVTLFFNTFQIVARYDVLLLQEIRDITGNSVRQLLALANQ